MDLRIPFGEAISEPRLLKNHWDTLSLPQQVALKTLYGLPMDSGEELRIYSCQQGSCTYDDLGYVQDVRVLPYHPKKYREGWFICGRRSGKTDRIASTIVAYEAAFGGHEQFARAGQEIPCYQIAQDIRMAMYALHFIRATLESSPIGYKMIESATRGLAVTKNQIRLKNGLTITCLPPTLKAVRGYASPVAVLDEVGVWYQESDSANPDYEIYRAIKPAQMQFPNPVLVGISSPWNKGGLLYKNFEAGTNGRNAPLSERHQYRELLVVHGPTAAMGNPLVTRESLEIERDRDAKAFERECLAIFQDSISGFLSSTLLKDAIDKEVVSRPYDPACMYVAAIDPAFRHDAFAFTIFHVDKQGMVVQDVIEQFIPPPGEVLNPDVVFSWIAPRLQEYNVVSVYSDQYHLESLQQLAMKHSFIIEGVPFKATNKASIYGSLQQLVNQRRIRLLDHPNQFKELASLERKLTQAGQVLIAAPQGQHDDIASVCALACYKCLWLLPSMKEEKPKDKTVFEQVQEQLKRQGRQRPTITSQEHEEMMARLPSLPYY